MAENNTNLRIHAKVTPAPIRQSTQTDSKKRRFLNLPFHSRKHKTTEPVKLTFGDRLLRNSALACALLLAILSLGNINQPWAQRASESVERALSMRIDLDEKIGGLSFVRDLMPESALVFLNLSGEHELAQPVDGELTHPFSNAQPWLVFDCSPGSSVTAVADGTVTAISQLSGETVGVLIDHGGGLESVYAFLADTGVQSGETIQKGQVIGTSENSVYFELRNGGSSIDPTERMGL